MNLIKQRKAVINPHYKQLDSFIKSLPEVFAQGKGKIIYKGRNELREFDVDGIRIVVKAFATPHFINRIAYGLFRASKAERSYFYASMLRNKGIESPEPIGYLTQRNGLLFTKSYYASLCSQNRYTYIDIIKHKIPNEKKFLKEIGRLAGKMHEAGMIHRDFSRGNLLLDERNNKIHIEVIDLNRIRFHKISIQEGIKNFERLPATLEMRKALAEGYAEIRKFNINECLKLWPISEEMDSPETGTRSFQDNNL